MRYWNAAPLVLALALFPYHSRQALAQNPKADVGPNAALKYWQAFALMPVLDNEEEKLLSAGNTAAREEDIAKLLKKSEMSLQYLHRGARLQLCDWSLDYDQGIFLPLPYAGKSRALARLAALDARHEFKQGHWKIGWEDVIAQLKLARHVETDPIMIVQLVGYGIETTAIETAAPYLPKLKSALAESPSAVVDALPGRPTIGQMLLKEKEVGPIWLIHAIRKAEQATPGSWLEVWKQALGPAVEGPKDEHEALVQSAKTPEQAIAKLEELFPLYDELANLVALPWNQFDARYSEFAERTKAANVLARYFVPGIDRLVTALRRSEAEMALFKAALGVVEGGSRRLKDFKDPFGDGPFEYRALEKGFDLKSKLLFKSQPVSLTFGSGSDSGGGRQ
jgi:hypothetical protein